MKRVMRFMKRTMCILGLVTIIGTMMLPAASAASATVDWPVTGDCYIEYVAPCRIDCYRDEACQIRGSFAPAASYSARIDEGDICYILWFGKTSCKISYPVSGGGRKEAFVLLKHLFGCARPQEKLVCTAKTTTYTTAEFTTRSGSVAVGDIAYRLGSAKKNKATLTLYPTSRGFKAAWVKDLSGFSPMPAVSTEKSSPQISVAYFTRSVKDSELQWSPYEPFRKTILYRYFTYNDTEYSKHDSGVFYCPTPGQAKQTTEVVFVSADVCTKLLKQASLRTDLLSEIKSALAGEATEEGINYIMGKMGIQVPGVGAALAVLQLVVSAQSTDRILWNEFVSACETNRGVLIVDSTSFFSYTYYTADGGSILNQSHTHIKQERITEFHSCGSLSDAQNFVAGISGNWSYKYK